MNCLGLRFGDSTEHKTRDKPTHKIEQMEHGLLTNGMY